MRQTVTLEREKLPVQVLHRKGSTHSEEWGSFVVDSGSFRFQSAVFCKKFPLSRLRLKKVLQIEKQKKNGTPIEENAPTAPPAGAINTPLRNVPLFQRSRKFRPGLTLSCNRCGFLLPRQKFHISCCLNGSRFGF